MLPLIQSRYRAFPSPQASLPSSHNHTHPLPATHLLLNPWQPQSSLHLSNVVVSRMFCKWNHIACSPLRQASFIQYNSLRCRRLWESAVHPFLWPISRPWYGCSRSFNSSPVERHGPFPGLGALNKASVHTCVQVFV